MSDIGWEDLFDGLGRAFDAHQTRGELGDALDTINNARVTGDRALLDRCVADLRAARSRWSEGYPLRPVIANLLGKALWVRYGWFQQHDDLVAAYEASGEAARYLGMADNRHVWLNDAALTAQAMFHRTADIGYLREALRFAERARAVADATGTADSGAHIRLASILLDRCELTGTDEGLDRAAQLCLNAMPRGPKQGMRSAYLLSTYGRTMSMKAQYGTSVDFADFARRDAKESEANADPRHPDTVIAQANLAGSLMTVAMATGDIAQLHEAQEKVDAALRALPEGHSGWSMLASLRSQILFARVAAGAGVSAGQEDVELSRRAADRALGTYREAEALVTYGAMLAAADRLADAISTYQDALRRFPDSAVVRTLASAGLADCRYRRYAADGDPQDRIDAITGLRDLARGASQSTLERIAAWLRLSQIGESEHDDRLALEGYRQAVTLLPDLAWRGLGRRSQAKALERFAGVATEAAATRVDAGGADAGHDALALLAAGRGILWGELSQLRADVDRLRHAHPDLARRLTAVRQSLDAPAGAEPERYGPSDLLTRERLAAEWDDLVGRVRTKDGFRSFAEPAPFILPSDATPTVVINVARRRCAAIIIRAGAARVLPLPLLSFEAAAEQARRLTQGITAYLADGDVWAMHQAVFLNLRWLWSTVVEPVLRHLKIRIPGDDDRLPAIRWAPTGVLASMPLHAAVAPLTAGRKPPVSAIDCVVSSYVSDLARSDPPGPGQASGPLMVDFIGAPDTPSLPRLEYVEDEYRNIRATVPGESWRPDRSTDRHTAIRLLRDSTAVHAAAHAGYDATGEPVLHLADGTIPVTELARVRTTQGRLAYLAACSTALGMPGLPDEAFHIAAALQIAGFTDVVGTLWPLNDPFAAQMAEQFYRRLNNADGNVARALNASQRAARDADPRLAGFWPVFLHFGPVSEER